MTGVDWPYMRHQDGLSALVPDEATKAFLTQREQQSWRRLIDERIARLEKTVAMLEDMANEKRR